jgi:hypothetical protein
VATSSPSPAALLLLISSARCRPAVSPWRAAEVVRSDNMAMEARAQRHRRHAPSSSPLLCRGGGGVAVAMAARGHIQGLCKSVNIMVLNWKLAFSLSI